jgi:hypothetical protein
VRWNPYFCNEKLESETKMMKKSILWLTLSAITLGLSACAGQKDNKEEEKERKGWELVWEDDFDQSPVTANLGKDTPQ